MRSLSRLSLTLTAAVLLGSLQSACGGSTAAGARNDAGADVTAPGSDGGEPDANPRVDASSDVNGGDASDGGEAGGDGACQVGLPAPTNHRPVAVACDATRPPGIDDPDAAVGLMCTADSQCTADAGSNGRCTGSLRGAVCTYDRCVTDTDCPMSNLCACGVGSPGGPRGPNICLESDCRIDSDCGPGGFCSPSFGLCGAYGGVVGYYCHTQCDDCTADEQCGASPGGPGPGYCAWQPAVGKWTCSNQICAG